MSAGVYWNSPAIFFLIPQAQGLAIDGGDQAATAPKKHSREQRGVENRPPPPIRAAKLPYLWGPQPPTAGMAQTDEAPSRLKTPSNSSGRAKPAHLSYAPSALVLEYRLG